MTSHKDLQYQKTKIRDYRDQVRGGLFQLYKLVTVYFPDYDVSSLIEMQNIIDNETKTVLQKILKHED